MPVEHQRKRHDTDAQRDHGEQEADAATDDNERPTFRRRQHALCEIRDGGRRSMTEGYDIDGVRGADPSHEQDEKARTESEDRAERRSAQDVYCVPRSGFLSTLAATAEFVEAERSKRTN